MEYGVLLNGQMLVHKHQHPGDKPIIRTTPPQIGEDELLAVYYEENDSQITEKWAVSKNEYDPIINAPTADESLTRYTNELTGDNAENIQEAAETLIKKFKEENEYAAVSHH